MSDELRQRIAELERQLADANAVTERLKYQVTDACEIIQRMREKLRTSLGLVDAQPDCAQYHEQNCIHCDIIECGDNMALSTIQQALADANRRAEAAEDRVRRLEGILKSGEPMYACDHCFALWKSTANEMCQKCMVGRVHPMWMVNRARAEQALAPAEAKGDTQ